MTDELTTVSFVLRVTGAQRVRDSKAKLRRKLKDKSLSRAERCRQYGYLQYRLRRGMR